MPVALPAIGATAAGAVTNLVLVETVPLSIQQDERVHAFIDDRYFHIVQRLNLEEAPRGVNWSRDIRAGAYSIQ